MTSQNKYDIQLEDFDGPLDLLLTLVKDKKINILEIDLIELCTQYLNIIQNLQENEIDIAGEYLVMASTLLQIKAKSLLETPKAKEEVEEDKNELLALLIEYQQFKQVSSTLREQEVLRGDIFIKKQSDLDEYWIDNSQSSKLDGSSNMLKLMSTLRKMFERVYAEKLRMTHFQSFKLTPKDMEPRVLEIFKNKEKATFEEVFDVPSLSHFVVTLIAVLDLARKQKIIIIQEEQFGLLRFEKGPEYEK
ncbi:segregation/condensation protein A [Mycoplasma sp. Ms02]|uniref:segregation/condensation protein A n=1 Tax=Mycoplasma sp. Ms02 TaxID=353851 RepID=UPI001C8A519C|nr:segregation/condensation protein A [Mycoplasma sp. Ms02]QZE12554.1 segregation/condensation protein A [Mycoplasma sp. Ms02]